MPELLDQTQRNQNYEQLIGGGEFRKGNHVSVAQRSVGLMREEWLL